MADEPTISPDDLRWKALVRRSGAGHRASADLRGRVEQVLREAPADEAPPAPAARPPAAGAMWRPFRGPWGTLRLAAAAVVLLIVGLGSYLAIHARHEREEREEYVEANRPLLTLMAALHETAGPASPGDYADVESGADQVARDLSRRLGHRVVVPDWTADGWQMAEALIVSLNGARAAQVRYVGRDGTRVSLYSVPISALHADAGDEYEGDVGNSFVSGYTATDSARCVVGGRQLHKKLNALRDRLKRM